MAVNPCWDKFKKDFPDIHNYLQSKTGVDFDGSDQSKQSFINAAKQLQNDSLSTLNDVYTGLGIEGLPEVKSTPEAKTDKYPTKKQFEGADQIQSIDDAEGRLSNGERIFAIPEMDEQPIELISVEDIRKYTPDQLLSVKRDYDAFKQTPETKEPKTSKAPKEEGVMKKARGIDDLQEPVDIVMQYFAGGNRINPSAIQELFGGRDQRLHQQKGTGGEHRSRISLLKKDAPSIKELAHSLWESSQDENGNSPYTDQDFRNAIEQVLGEHNSPSSMAKELVKKYLTTAVAENLTEAEAAEMDAGAIAQIDELLADLPQKHKDQILGLLQKYQDQYGIVDWEAIEKDINGFTPNILSLPLSTQRELDGLVKKYYAEGQGESGDVLSEDNIQEQAEVAEVANAPPTESEVEAAQSAYDKAVAALKKAEDKISKQQSTQGSLLPSEGAQGAMFGVNRDEAKSILDPLRQQVKETKAALDAAQKSTDATAGQPELALPSEGAETFYSGGDLVQYTGNSFEKYGATWHEFTYLEGIKKGQTGVTKDPPKNIDTQANVAADQHRDRIRKEFKERFASKGIPRDQIDGALALMEARANAWAYEQPGRISNQWYGKIAGIKGGEFEEGDIQYQSGKLKAAVIGAAMLHSGGLSDTPTNKLQEGEKAKTEIAAKQGTTVNIKDDRDVDGVSGKKLDATKRLSYRANVEVIRDVIRSANKHGVDPYTALAIGYQETGLSGYGDNEENVFHVLNNDKGFYGETPAETTDNGVFLLNKYFDYAKKLGKKGEAQTIQSWNGYGKVGKNTEGSQKALYGIDVSKEPIDMSKNPIYGRRILDIRENILKKSPELAKIVEEEKNNVAFQQEGGIKHGAVETLKDGKVVIHALESPNVSTMVHEIFHVFEKDLTDAERKQVDDFGGSEPFARAGERYLRTGVAPNAELKPLFQKFADWLKNIYKSLVGSPIEKNITPEIKKIFDRLLTPTTNPPSIQGGANTGSVTPPLTSEKIGDPARAFADKLRQGKINKLGGFKTATGFDAIWDAAVEVIAKAIDAGAEIADAIQEGLLYIKKTDWYKNLTDKKAFDKQFTDHLNNQIGAPPAGTPPDTHRFSNSESSRERVRGAYEHLMNSEISEGVKEKFKSGGLTKNGLGIKYKVSDNAEAHAAGKAIVSAFGADEALRLARTNTFHPSVNSAVFSEAINEFYNQEQSAKTPKEKFAAAARWADTYNEYAELLTASGQFGQYAFQFYKTSPLGFILSAKERLDERRKHFLDRDEKSLKEAFEFLKDLPEFQEIFAGEVQEAVKKSKHEIKKEVRKKISDAFDKLKLNKNNTYATFVPPPIINGAIEAMKQAVLLGYEVVDVISEGVKYINARYNEGWDQEKFETEFTPVVENILETEVRKTSEKEKKKILDKWDRKLTKLDPAKRKELLSRALAEIVRSGGLDFEKFKEMYADALGLPSMTPEMETKLKGLGEKLNGVDKAKEKLDKDPSEENIKEFLKAMNEGENASRQVNDLLGEKGITLDRFLSIAKLNTLGLANLFINPFFNVSFMPIRFLESMLKTGMDYALKYAGFTRSDGLYENTIYKQRGYFKGFGKGFVKSIINLYKGDQQFDYFQKTTRQNIQPVESAREIFAHFQGSRPLTKSELANAFMEAWPTMGVSAAIISRGLQVGDLPFRFAAERATAENIATQKGLTGVKKQAFILNPDEESAEKITNAGERAVMAQDNLLTDFLSRASSFFTHSTQDNKAGKAVFGAAKVVGATTQPFLKIPLNSAMTTFELAVPEFAVLKGFYYAMTGNRDEALSAFARAAVGYAIGLAVTQIAEAGLLSGTDDDKKKINTSIYKGDIVGDKTINFTGFKRWILGGDPAFQDGDVTISVNGLGPVGALMVMKAQQYDKMSPEQWKQEGYLANLWERTHGGFLNGLKNNVFGNTSTLFSAINDGSSYSVNKWLRGSSNVMLNAFEPSWLATASKLNDKYRPDYSAMNLGQQMTATLKERFWSGDDLPKQITVWGQKREDAPKGTNPILYYYADITKQRNVDTDDFGFNILALYNRTLKDAAIPSRPEKVLEENKQSVELSPKQFEEFQVMVGTQRKQLVKMLMNTDVYNNADDYTKVELLKKQYQNGRQLGEREFWFRHPELYPQKKKK